jgi:hypothetical protein
MAEEKLPHTAIPTWSGFIYQGRVALLHVLKMLNEKNKEDYNLWYLQIDSIEDFSIVKYDNLNKIVPLTMHQVKAVKSTAYSTYKDDFEQLERKKKATKNDDVIAYFHLATKNDEPKTSIEAKHPDLKIYCYENNTEFCPLSNIDSHILQLIEKILSRENFAGSRTDELKRIKYETLEKKIADIVLAIHACNHRGQPIREAAFETLIPLNKFFTTILDDTIIVQNEPFFEARLRMDLNRYYQEFYFESEGQNWSEDMKRRMDNYQFIVNELNSSTFKSFLQNIIPHKSINYSTLIGYKDNSLNQDEMKEAFFHVLSQIRESNSGSGLGWVCSNGKHFYPTSIKDSDSEQSKKRISEKILNTALTTNVNVPFDSDYLVTSECNVDNMAAYANNIGQVDIDDMKVGEDDRNYNITQWKRVGLIDVETAKNKLND